MKAALKLSKYLKPYWVWATLAPLLMLLEVSMDLMQPRMIQRIIDQGIGKLDMAVITQTGLLMIGFALLGAVGGVGCTITSVLASHGFGTDLRGDLFRKVQSLSFGNIDELETGQIITRLTNDVTQVQEMVFMMLRSMVRSPLLLLGSLLMAILTSPRLAILTSPRLALTFLGLIPFVGLILGWVIRKAYPLFGLVQERLDDLNTVMQENLAGVRVIKAFVRAGHEIQRFGHANDRLMDQTIRANLSVAVTFPAMMLILNLGIAGALWFGGVQVTVGEMQVGELIAFTNYLAQTLMSLLFVSMLMMRLARAQASTLRIEEVLASSPKILHPSQARDGFTPRCRVAFENVTFSYERNGENPVLKDITFTAEPGQTVAI